MTTNISNRKMVFNVTKRSPLDYTETTELIIFRNNNWQQAKVSVERLSKFGYSAIVKSDDKEVVMINLKPTVDINDLKIQMAKSGQEFAKVCLQNLPTMCESDKIIAQELVKRWKSN